MLSDQVFFLINRDPLVIGFKGQHAGGIGKGDTVAVGFKVDQKLRTTFDPQDQAGIKIGLGEGDEEGFLLLDKQSDRSFADGAMNSAIGHLISPEEGLVVKVSQGEEGSTREEIGFDIGDCFFDSSLLMGRSDITGGGVEEVVSGEGQEAGIELDSGADAVKDDAGEVVITDFLYHPLKEMESPPMGGHKRLDRLGGEEFEVEHATKGEDHDETVNPFGGDLAGIGPIALSLLSRGGLNVEKDFGSAPEGPQVISKDTDASTIAELLNLLVNTQGTDCGVMIEKLPDLILKGIEFGGPWLRRSSGEGLLLQGAPHGFGVDPQLSGNGLLAEFFDVVKMTD